MALIGLDISGSNVRAGRIENKYLAKVVSTSINPQGDKFEIFERICTLIDEIFSGDIIGIGFGIPGVIDLENGIVNNITNLPSWKRFHVREFLKKKYRVPIYINNDANCFALGEKHFGKLKKIQNSVALIIDIGVGAGIIINNKLYSGKNCIAGEFGMLPYKDNNFDYYCGYRFFRDTHKIAIDDLFEKAQKGDRYVLKIFEEYGVHLGNLIKMILCSIDPEMIVLGGSLSQYFNLFEEKMWDSIREFYFPHSLKNLKIEVSELEQIAVKGAAALYYDAQESETEE
jgi:glucokinase